MKVAACQLFQSTLPAKGATRDNAINIGIILISIHAPRGGSDSTWGAKNNTMANFNPRSPRGERQEIYAQGTDKDDISIHAPREGSDLVSPRDFRSRLNFNPRSPRGGATCKLLTTIALFVYFNPRSPRGERPPVQYRSILSILFQSTLPAGGATCRLSLFKMILRYFNPRSPRGERRLIMGGTSRSSYFNPRSPRGERPFKRPIIIPCSTFQSTLPAGGATISFHVAIFQLTISIHAPRGGSDSRQLGVFLRLYVFQSTLPAGGATYSLKIDGNKISISIHAPRGGSDPCLLISIIDMTQFQSTLPAGGATVQSKHAAMTV